MFGGALIGHSWCAGRGGLDVPTSNCLELSWMRWRRSLWTDSGYRGMVLFLDAGVAGALAWTVVAGGSVSLIRRH
eukprot:scaffold20322_cov45-Attheya_sp.AAC.2